MATQQKRATANATAKAKSSANANKAQDQETRGESSDTILDAIRCLRDDLLKRMDDNAKTQSLELKQQISQLREELMSSIEHVSSRTRSLEGTVESLQSACNGHSDIIAELGEQVKQLTRDVKAVSDKNEDLEARSRRCNLRITGVKEGREAKKAPVAFIAGLLKVTLGLDSPPTLDRSHRTLRERPGDEEPPRAFVIKCHYFQEKEAILRKAAKAKGLTTPDGDKIGIHPDYTQAVVKQRATFRDVKKILRDCDDVEYRLRYPAVLLITTKSNGQRHSFTDPIKAKDFALTLPGASAAQLD